MKERIRQNLAEYDRIASEYAKLNSIRPLYQFAVYPSFFHSVGDIRGKDALDLACGEGVVARALKSMGARRVVGVDLSPKMLDLAKNKEGASPLGIEYQQGRVGRLGKIGEFDVATGAFLLHYARNRDELNRMCADVSKNLRAGGVFTSINNNSLFPIGAHPKYENDIVTAEGPLVDGTELHVSFGTDEMTVSFKNYFWRRETYEDALRMSGFEGIEWLPITPTQEGVDLKGEDFWKDFLEKPFFVIVRARKSGEVSDTMEA